MEDGTEEQYMQEGEEYDENYVELQEGNEGEGEGDIGETEDNGQQNGEQGYSDDLQGRIQAILDRTGYPHQITTGQRKFGPPPNYDGPTPGAGHEVYIGKLPNDAYEDELIPLFETFGTIWDMRIMMDPATGKTKGFGFVTFMEKESAQQAARACDGKSLRTHGKAMKANVSIPNNRLFVGNIPKSKSKEDIHKEFSRTIEGIEEVIVYAHPDDTTKKNRGFCFLDFESHGAASTARKKIMSGRFTFFKMAVICDWADPQDEPDQETMSKVKVLYIRNLKADVTEEKLEELFQQYGALEKVKRVKDYGFVHFHERQDALRALEELNNTMIESSQMLITLAKPPIDSKIKEKRKMQHTIALTNAGFVPGGAMRGMGMARSRGGIRGMRSSSGLGMRGSGGMGPRGGMGYSYGNGSGYDMGYGGYDDYSTGYGYDDYSTGYGYEEDYGYDEYDASYYAEDDTSFGVARGGGRGMSGSGMRGVAGIRGSSRGRGAIRSVMGGASGKMGAVRGGRGTGMARGLGGQASRGRGAALRGPPVARGGPMKRKAPGQLMSGIAPKKPAIGQSKDGWGVQPLAQQPLSQGGDAWYDNSYDGFDSTWG